MKRLFAAAYIWLVCATAYAGSADLSWVAPTKNTDGTTLTDLTGYKIVYGTSATALTQSIAISTPAATTYTVGNLAAGTWYFAVRAVAGGSRESVNSNIASKVIAPSTPAAPTGLTVLAETVFTVVKQPDRFVLLPVGTVPAGTKCVDGQSVNGMSVVPRAAVTWYGSVKPDVVVGTCG